MAQYQIGSSVYEIPDNTPPDQLDEILRELAKQSSTTASAQPTGPDTSFGSAFMQGIDQPLENIGTTLQATGLAPEFGQTLKDATQAPQNYESAAARFINPQAGDRVLNIPGLGEYGIEYLPRAAVEQVGQYAGSLISKGAGATAGGLVAGLPGAVAGAIAGPALFEFAQQLGPVAIERAKNDGRSEPNWDDWTYAAATAGVSGLLNSIGVSGGKGAGFLNKTLREGVTEGSQSVVEQTGTTIDTEKGLTVSAKQAVGEGIIGGTTAGGFDATARLFTGGDSGPADPEAATELANRLKKIAEEGGPEGKPEFDLGDVDRMSQTGARAVVEAAHKDIQTEIKQAVKDLRERLQVQDNDNLDTVLKKVQAQAAVEMARNKTKSVITAANFEAVKDLAGDTAEGQRLLSLIRQSNELTAVHNDGYQGGLSQITDQFSPFGSKAGYDRGFATLERIVRPIASIGAATANPLIPAAQIGAVGIGRGVDALTGRRSRVRRYIEQNAGQGGIPQQTLPSLRAAAIAEDEQQQQAAEAQLAADAARQAESEQINLELARRNAPPVPNSPQGTMEDATGLDRDGVAAALRILKKTRLGRQLADTIAQYENSVARGGSVDRLSALIRAVNDIADTPSALDVGRVRPRNMNTQQNQLQLDARIEQGKRDNQAFNDELMRGLKADKTVDAQSKAIGEAALTNLRRDLGRSPLKTATAIVADAQKRAKNPNAIEKYVQPYLERVQRQQQVDDASAEPEMEQMFEANAFKNHDTTTTFYHGTPHPFKDFAPTTAQRPSTAGNSRDGIWMVSNPNVAETYSGNNADNPNLGNNRPSILPLYLPKSRTQTFKYDMGDYSVRDDNGNQLLSRDAMETQAGEDILAHLQQETGADLFVLDMDGATYSRFDEEDGNLRPNFDDNEVLENVIERARDAGFKGVIFKNYGDDYAPVDGFTEQQARNFEHTIADHAIVFDGYTDIVRSKFNPEASATPEMEQMFEAEGPNDPMRVSTRTPTAVAAFENPLAQDLQVDIDAIRAAPGNLLKKMMQKLNKYEGAKGFRRENKGVPAEQQFKNFLKSNLLHLYNSVSPEYRDRARQWYVGANKLSQAVADQYGLSLAQVSGVMAALSPQQDWYMNYDIGVRVIDTFTKAQNEVFSPDMEAAMQRFMDNPANANKRPLHQARLEAIRGKTLAELNPIQAAYFVRFYDEVNNPNGAKYRYISPEGELLEFATRKDGEPASIRMNGFGNIEKAISMIQDGSRENISASLGDRHKVRSFYNNILNPMSDRGDVTIDTHAVAAALLQPLAGADIEVSHNLGTSGDTSSITGVKGSYGIFADAYREAAAEAGVLPREMQSITWEAVRGLYSSGFKNAKNKKAIKEIWKNYDKGTISLDEARGAIYDKARGIDPAAWEDRTEPFGRPDATGRDSSGFRADGLSNQSGELSSDFIPGSGDGQSGRRPNGQSAGVLSLPAEAGQLRSDASLTDLLADIYGRDNYAPGSIVSGSRPATPTEVEQQLEAVERLLADGKPIEIGKSGSAFENGIKSLQVIRRLAAAMNVSFVLANNLDEINARRGGSSEGRITRGMYSAINYPVEMAEFGNLTESRKRVSGEDMGIMVLKPGALAGYSKMTLAESTMVAAHELGHHIARLRLDPDAYPKEIFPYRNYTTGKLSRDERNMRHDNSFEGEIQKLINKAFGKNPDAAREIIEELINLQRKGTVQILEGSGGTAMIREGYIGLFKQLDDQRKKAGLTEEAAESILRKSAGKRRTLEGYFKDQDQYQQQAVELSADLLAVYMVDPKFMKEQAPKAARFARAYLNSADTGKLVQFFSAPFAAIVAAIMANMLVGEGEEEDKEQRRGILSA